MKPAEVRYTAEITDATGVTRRFTMEELVDAYKAVNARNDQLSNQLAKYKYDKRVGEIALESNVEATRRATDRVEHLLKQVVAGKPAGDSAARIQKLEAELTERDADNKKLRAELAESQRAIAAWTQCVVTIGAMHHAHRTGETDLWRAELAELVKKTAEFGK